MSGPELFFMAANAATQAISAIGSADASAANANAQANTATAQAGIARQNAANARLASNADQEEQARKSAYALGQRRAALLGAGIGAAGSAADLYAQDVGNETYKALQIRYRGEVNAGSLLNQAGLADQQAAIDRNRADAAQSAGYLGAATSLLGAAGKLYKSGGDTFAGAGSAGGGYMADDLRPGSSRFA